jgi:hypothetical protein
MKHHVAALIVALLLAGCDNDGYYASEICRERDVGSGTCTKGEFVCKAPMVLKSSQSLTPRCYMPGAAQ